MDLRRHSGTLNLYELIEDIKEFGKVAGIVKRKYQYEGPYAEGAFRKSKGICKTCRDFVAEMILLTFAPPEIRSLKEIVSAVGKECFAVVRTSDSGSESRWFDSSHRFAGVVQNPFCLSPHFDIASAVEKEFFGLINPVSPVQVRPVTNLALVYEGGDEASQ